MGLTARRVSFTLAMLGCTVATGLVLYKASGPETAPADEGLAAEPTAPATIAEVADVPQAASLSNGFGFSGAADSPETRETLETLESLTEAELSSLEAAENEAGNPFSLDELMPPPASFVPAREPSAEPEPGDIGATLKEEVPPADSVIPASESVQDLLEKNDLPGKEEAEPDESPQPTRTQSVMAVALSDIDEAGSTELSESKLTRLKLQFPLDVPLELEGDESDWSIRDTRKNVVVASVRAGDDGTQLKWTAGAGQSPSASALVHGRISGEDGSIFLRPTIEADPWKIRVDQHDVMPTWDLADPVPPRVTRVSIQFDLPDNVEEAWMEPIDSESPRRSRGLAVLTPEDGETVSLGLRFDVRCSRKLSCRIRYAGRLDPSMPWQVVSVPLLNQFADQLAQEATLVSNEAARLSRVYEIAGSAGRRILRVKQERNDARAEAIVQWSGRVAELQSLISTLEAEARLNVRVWVVWPDSEQELLTMQRESDDQR